MLALLKIEASMAENTGEKIAGNEMGSKLGMKALAIMMRLFPRFVVYGFSMLLVLFYYVTKREGRASSAKYQEMLGLEHGPVRRFFFGLGQVRAFSHVILDNMYLGIFGSKKFHLEEFGTDKFRKVLEGGRGLILLSAHVGNWHLAVNFLSNTGANVHLVIDDTRHEEVRKQMDVAKASGSHLTVHNAAKGPDLVFELNAALRRGEVVILAGDRVTGPRRIRIQFLGGTAWFPTTAFSLAAVTKAPICTALIFRTEMQRYECHGIGPFDKDIPDDVTDREARTELMAKNYVSHLETYIKRFPKQWFNFFDFWADE